MLELENLNDQTAEEAINIAKRKIAQITDEWTSYQEYDPGITLIELFGWLKSVQQEYMNNISKRSQRAFLDLFSIKRKLNRGAKAVIAIKDVSSDMQIPSGTKWCTDDEMIFENNEEQHLSSANIVEVGFKNPDDDLTIDYKEFDGKRLFSLFGDLTSRFRKAGDVYFTIKLDVPFMQGKPISFYFELFQNEENIRNPIDKGFKFTNMANVIWEYYSNVDGEIGWHSAEIIKDDTNSLLFSGIVLLKFKENMILHEGGYLVRAKLTEGNYDFPPRATMIRINVFEVEQKETLCENKIFSKQDLLSENTLSLSTSLGLYGEHQVYLKQGDAWIVLNKFSYERKIQEGKTLFYFESLPEDLDSENSIMIVSYDKKIPKGAIIGESTGVSNQKIAVDFKGIYYEKFNIIVEESEGERTVFKPWQKVESFVSSDKYEKHYILNCRNSEIIFGNHIRGQIPQRLNKNIRLISLACTLGKGSNIKAYTISSAISENEEINNLKVNQITNATGGTDLETLEEMRGRALHILNRGDKAVTAKDYEYIVKNTPGLIINKVKILHNYFPSQVSDASICVTIVVKSGEKKTLLPSYKENIMRNIERFRLVNTQVAVIGPSYVKLEISGEIVVSSHYDERENTVANAISEFILGLNDTFGQVLHFSDIFELIDKLDCVSYVKKLRIEPTGEYKKKLSSGDVIPKPNGMYEVKSINLLVLRSENI